MRLAVAACKGKTYYSLMDCCPDNMSEGHQKSGLASLPPRQQQSLPAGELSGAALRSVLPSLLGKLELFSGMSIHSSCARGLDFATYCIDDSRRIALRRPS